MTLNEWANRWNVPPEMYAELMRALSVGVEPPRGISAETHSEAWVQSHLQLNLAKAGGRAWRNNVGAGKLSNGSFVRWGLCNESKQQNEKIKSSDLIGIKPHVVMPSDVGRTLGIFWAREVKVPGWVYNDNDPHQRAQMNYVRLVTSLGGDARMTCDPEDI